jgi:hypothetical protein
MSSNAMGNATTPAKGAGKAKNNEKWNTEESLKLVMTLFQAQNPTLAISGWNSIGEELQKVDETCTIPAAK